MEHKTIVGTEANVQAYRLMIESDQAVIHAENEASEEYRYFPLYLTVRAFLRVDKDSDFEEIGVQTRGVNYMAPEWFKFLEQDTIVELFTKCLRDAANDTEENP